MLFRSVAAMAEARKADSGTAVKGVRIDWSGGQPACFADPQFDQNGWLVDFVGGSATTPVPTPDGPCIRLAS